jgi:hypothetical protein
MNEKHFNDNKTAHDLSLILNESIKKYGRNKDYPLPTIKWSDMNMLNAFGKYQAWDNTIIINRLLNTDRISHEALESVVYHEYSHQVYSSEEDNEKHLIKTIPHYIELFDELNNNFDINMFPETPNNTLPLSSDAETLIVRMRCPDENQEAYINEDVRYFDHYFYGWFDYDVSFDFNHKIYPQVIFTVEVQGYCSVVGWAKNVLVYGKEHEVNLKQYDFENIEYQFKCKPENARFCFCESPSWQGYSQDLPNYSKNGYCSFADVPAELKSIIIETINRYEYNFADYWFDDRTIECLDAILTEDDKHIADLAMAMSEKNLNRALWLINKSISIISEPYKYRYRALILRKLQIYDLAEKDLIELRKSNDTSFCTSEELDRYIDNLNKAHKELCKDYHL